MQYKLKLCACGQTEWVICGGVVMCRACYHKSIGKAHWLNENKMVSYKPRRHEYEI